MAKLRFPWLLAALLCFGGAGVRLPVAVPQAASRQTTAALDLPGYVAELDRCARELPRIAGEPARIAGFRQTLPREWVVRTRRSQFRVSNLWLDVALASLDQPGGKSEQALRQAVRRLAFLRAEATELAGPATALSAASARPRLDGILERREFRGLGPPSPLAIWWRKLLLRIATLLERLLARLHLDALGGNVLAYGLLAAALALLVLWWWRSLAGRASPLEISAASRAPAESSRHWLGEALAAADQGDYREAIRCGYWAGVGCLIDAGALPGDRALTPRERLRLIAARPEESKQLSDLTSRFELVWYGYRPPSAGDWLNTRAELERMGCPGLSTAAIARS
ncbi:MAG TPA: DUF4129 domain-containing protein [Candidatus Acidoferrales bacterium]|nr:DUF4129 domain-containing protein [Candidatus Acidoferrales bacterium]